MNGLMAKSKKELEIVLNELIDRVQPVFGDKLKKAILFGSYAREDNDGESDIDVMFMIDEDDISLEKYNDIVAKIEAEIDLKYDVVTASILQNEKKFLKYQHIIPFYMNVCKEGVTLYEQ